LFDTFVRCCLSVSPPLAHLETFLLCVLAVPPLSRPDGDLLTISRIPLPSVSGPLVWNYALKTTFLAFAPRVSCLLPLQDRDFCLSTGTSSFQKFLPFLWPSFRLGFFSLIIQRALSISSPLFWMSIPSCPVGFIASQNDAVFSLPFGPCYFHTPLIVSDHTRFMASEPSRPLSLSTDIVHGFRLSFLRPPFPAVPL